MDNFTSLGIFELLRQKFRRVDLVPLGIGSSAGDFRTLERFSGQHIEGGRFFFGLCHWSDKVGRGETIQFLNAKPSVDLRQVRCGTERGKFALTADYKKGNIIRQIIETVWLDIIMSRTFADAKFLLDPAFPDGVSPTSIHSYGAVHLRLSVSGVEGNIIPGFDFAPNMLAHTGWTTFIPSGSAREAVEMAIRLEEAKKNEDALAEELEARLLKLGVC